MGFWVPNSPLAAQSCSSQEQLRRLELRFLAIELQEIRQKHTQDKIKIETAALSPL